MDLKYEMYRIDRTWLPTSFTGEIKKQERLSIKSFWLGSLATIY